jgi:hypothetical protein
MKCSWPALSMNDENVAKLLQLWLGRCEITEQIANQIGISYRSFQKILKENFSVLCVCVCVCVCVHSMENVNEQYWQLVFSSNMFYHPLCFIPSSPASAKW